MFIKSFQEIKAWQKSHALTLEVYLITEHFPKHELFGLISQIRRAVVSIPSNLAEGFRRKTKNDSLHFYNISQSSLEEVRYQLLLAKDLKYISELKYSQLAIQAEEVSKLINGWIKSQK